MIGDAKPTCTNLYYIHPHPNPTEGCAHKYIFANPAVRFLTGKPPTF